MNRNFTATALSLLLLGGASVALAQEDKTTEKKVTTTAGTEKSKMHSVTGTVTKYEAGKKITVDLGHKKTKSFTLDSSSVNTTVDPAVAIGSKVKVVQSKNAEGMKTLTITPAS